MFESFGFFASSCWIKLTSYLIFRGKHHKVQLVNHHQKFLKREIPMAGLKIVLLILSHLGDLIHSHLEEGGRNPPRSVTLLSLIQIKPNLLW